MLLAVATTQAAFADTHKVSSKAVGGLRLTATIDSTLLDIRLTLTNVGKRPLVVTSHVATHETHYDPFTIELAWPKADPKTGACRGAGRLVLKLLDSRDKSATVTKQLAPGASLSHTISIPAWAARDINGRHVLGGSYYKIAARYRVTGGTGWTGELVTPAAKLFGLDQMRTDVCRRNPGWDTF